LPNGTDAGRFLYETTTREAIQSIQKSHYGWDHIDILKTFLPASKERVGKVDTNNKDAETTKQFYADIVHGGKAERPAK